MSLPGATVALRHETAQVVPFTNTGTFVGPWVIETYTANGAISPEPGIKMLSKTSALSAITLAAPQRPGDTILLICGTAFAHVVTATGLIQDGVTGGAKSTLTFGAFVGASLGLVGLSDGTWAVTVKNVVTIT